MLLPPYWPLYINTIVNRIFVHSLGLISKWSHLKSLLIFKVKKVPSTATYKDQRTPMNNPINIWSQNLYQRLHTTAEITCPYWCWSEDQFAHESWHLLHWPFLTAASAYTSHYRYEYHVHLQLWIRNNWQEPQVIFNNKCLNPTPHWTIPYNMQETLNRWMLRCSLLVNEERIIAYRFLSNLSHRIYLRDVEDETLGDLNLKWENLDLACKCWRISPGLQVQE